MTTKRIVLNPEMRGSLSSFGYGVKKSAPTCDIVFGEMAPASGHYGSERGAYYYFLTPFGYGVKKSAPNDRLRNIIQTYQTCRSLFASSRRSRRTPRALPAHLGAPDVFGEAPGEDFLPVVVTNQ
jgi:hypothetical protein